MTGIPRMGDRGFTDSCHPSVLYLDIMLFYACIQLTLVNIFLFWIVCALKGIQNLLMRR
jgi:hypothetical protein